MEFGGVVSGVVLSASTGSGYGASQIVFSGGIASGTKVHGRQLEQDDFKLTRNLNW